MKSTCEAIRRDGSRCPNQWKHALHTVYLCGQHKNALHKGIMVVHVVADPGHREAFVSADRDGTYSYSSEVAS